MKKVLLLFLIFFLTGCSETTKTDFPSVKVLRVYSQMPNDNKKYSGFIEKEGSTELSFGVSGIMNGLYVNEGDFVKKGKLLAKLDNDEYKFEINRAQTELQEALVKYNRIKSYYDRISRLHDAGGISYNDWEAAQTDLKSGLNAISISRDALMIARKKAAFTNIYAPRDGYIIKSYKDEMQFVPQGDAVFLFQSASGNAEASLFVSQKDINAIRTGQGVYLHIDATGKTYAGKVKNKVNSSLNEGSYKVKVRISESVPEILDGMSVSAEIPNNAFNKGFLLPVEAVFGEAGGKFVYILTKNDENMGIVHKTRVISGSIAEDKIEITGGLNDGDFVVVQGIENVADNEEVRFYE